MKKIYKKFKEILGYIFGTLVFLIFFLYTTSVPVTLYDWIARGILFGLPFLAYCLYKMAQKSKSKKQCNNNSTKELIRVSDWDQCYLIAIKSKGGIYDVEI